MHMPRPVAAANLYSILAWTLKSRPAHAKAKQAGPAAGDPDPLYRESAPGRLFDFEPIAVTVLS